MDHDEGVFERLFAHAGSRWWYASEIIEELGMDPLPECVSEAKLPNVSFGAWLARRRDKTVGDWRLEGKGSGGDVVRWRVLPDLL